MRNFQILDLIAFGYFCVAWVGYTLFARSGRRRKRTISAAMNKFRRQWLLEMSHREIRLVDVNALASLAHNMTFFASTTILVIGGLFALLGSSDRAISALAGLPFAVTTSQTAWEIKDLLLIVIFVYAFFQFAWASRMSNYCAILIGAAPAAGSPEAAAHAERAARMTNLMGHHFNLGLRAYFFALAFLGWFVHPWLLIVATTLVVMVNYWREFRSPELRALQAGLDTGPR
ncbi:MAG TPA: DUF599 domain-containing protein [Alphaproteobacteria bacterium]|jgi:uncharacterized membrane protein|nr:DUF599 domain-containing protein [Alphaproteobacteria bacterium]